MDRTHVLVMAKSPVAGRAKTRLSPPFDQEQAAEIAEAALADTLEAVAQCGADRRILALDGAPGPWLPSGFDVVPQASGPFQHRLATAWEYAGGPGLQIGMDTPQVTPDLLNHGLQLLTDHEALLGLADDGGWWVIGLRRWRAGVFDNVAMSTSHTGFDQYARLCELGLAVRMLPSLCDLDTAADADAIASAAPTTRTARAVRSSARIRS